MHCRQPHPILRQLAGRMRCRPCRYRAALLLLVVVLALVAAVTGCGEGGMTDPENASPETTLSDAPAVGLAPDLATDPDVAAGAVAESPSLAAARLPKSFFVDPRTGKDTNPGTKSLPFKTLVRALGSALGQDTVRLATGVYSKATNGEHFTNSTQNVLVRPGVLILGTFAEEFTSQLHGAPDEVGLLLQGGATVRDVIMSGFGTAIFASQGSQFLKRVILDQNIHGIDLTNSAQATLTSSSVFATPPASVAGQGVRVTDQAQLIMDGGFIAGGGPNCVKTANGLELRGSARATLRNKAQIKDIAGNALLMLHFSKATLKGLTTVARDFSQLPSCNPLASIATYNSASLTLQNARLFGGGGDLSVGIESHSTGPLTVTNSVLQNHSRSALQVFTNTKLVINGSSFSGNDFGIDGREVLALNMSITGSTVSNNTTGIMAPSFKLRSSKVTGNLFGIVVTSASADLGTVDNFGNNTLTANSVTAVEFGLPLIKGVGTIFAAGNLWNASTQGSDANGHYPGDPVVDGESPLSSGKNFRLPVGEPGYKIQL